MFNQTMNLGATMNPNATMAGGGGGARGAVPAPVNEQEMITYIVEQINKNLSRSYSLADFDSLLPDQLLQVVSDCFGIIAPWARVDLEVEQYDSAMDRLYEFLTKICNYKPSVMQQQTFAQDFVNGEKAVLYPILWWFFHKMPDLRKRVYLARFLMPIDVPEDLRMQDDMLREMYDRWDGLRNDFKEIHRRVDALKEASADPAEQRRRLTQLEMTKGNLEQAIESSKKKLDHIPNKEAMLNACKSLRSETDESHRLNTNRDEMRLKVVSAKRRVEELQNRLRDVRRDVNDNRIDSIIQRLQDELSVNTQKLENELPEQLNERRVQIAALMKVTNETFDLQALQNEYNHLEKELNSLNQKMAERHRPGQDGQQDIMTLKASVQRVQKKKQEALTDFNNADSERQRLTELIQAREQQLEQLRNTKVLRGDEFKRFQNQVRAKTLQTKQMKTRLEDLRGELGVLQYTESLLKAKNQDLADELNAIESSLGAKGYVKAKEDLDRVDVEREAAQQATGATLQELAVIVQDLGTKIRNRRERLKPQLDALREARDSAHTVEQEHDEKKNAYEYQQSLLMQEVTKLETELGQLSDETRVNEALFHRMSGQLKIVAVQKKRCEDEKEFRAGSKALDATAKTYAALLHRTVESLESRTKDLQKRRRDIDETHENNVQQVEAFSNLRKLLELKEKILRSQTGGGGASEAATTIDQDLRKLNQKGGGNGAGAGAGGADVFVV